MTIVKSTELAEDHDDEKDIPQQGFPKLTHKIKAKTGGKTKHHILQDPTTLRLLLQAFQLNATIEQAAWHAGVSVSALKVHLKANTPVVVNEHEMGFKDLVKSCKGHTRLLAKKKIYMQLADKNDKSTQDAWRLLERQERGDYGLESGQLGIDSGVKIDVHEEAMKRAGKYSKN